MFSRLRVYPFVFLLSLCFSTGKSQSDILNVSCELDTLIEIEKLWDSTLVRFEEEFAREGFETSPCYQVIEKESRKWVRFSVRPFTNVRSKMTIFGEVSANEAEIVFEDEIVRKLTIEFGEFDDEESAREIYRKCAGLFQQRYQIEPEDWRFAHDPTSARNEMVQENRAEFRNESTIIDAIGLRWELPLGIALLDFTKRSPGKNSVRLRVVATDDPKRLNVEEFYETLRSGLIPCSLSEFLQLPSAWRMTTDEFESAFALPAEVPLKKSPYFQWLTADKSRAIFYRRPYSNQFIDLRLTDEIPIEEAIVDFRSGRIHAITISVFNLGDSGVMKPGDFQKLHRKCGKFLTSICGAQASLRPPDTRTGIKVSGYQWLNPKRGVGLLEYNPEAVDKRDPRIEYLRIKLMPRESESMGARKTQLLANVKKEENGDVWIPGIPMVDQGQKGYCVVAACQRVFEYYRVPIDQHQIAPLFNSDAEKGTKLSEMEASLNMISQKFHTRFAPVMKLGREPISDVEFARAVSSHIDQGIPLLWSMVMSRLPEKGDDLSQSQGGGHMRLIIGYNSEERTLIFTDTWGLGHERKTANVRTAMGATTALFRFEPSMN